MSRRALPALAAILALAATLTLAIPALAAPPPEPVCTSCQPAYERAVEDADLDVTVAQSGAVVMPDENGNATWRVGLAFTGPDAAELAGNDSLHRRLAADAVGDGFVGIGPGHVHVGNDGPEFPDAEHVRYYRFRDPEFARNPLGDAVVITKFREDLQGENYAGLGVDEVRVWSFSAVARAPPGTAAFGGLEGSSFTLTEQRSALAVLAPNGALADFPTTVWGYTVSLAALAAVLLPVVVENAAIVVLPALGVHALVTGGLFVLLAGSFPEPGGRERRVVGGLLGAMATLLALQPMVTEPLGAPFLGAPEPLLLGPAAAFAVVAVGAVRPSLIGVDSPRPLALRALGAGAVAGAVAGTLAPGTTGWAFAMWRAFDPVPPGATAWDGLGFTLMVAGPTLALVPAGAALAEGRTRGALTTALAGAALGWVASPALYFAQTGLVLPGFLLGFPAVGAVLLLGAPLLLAGWVLAEKPTPPPTEP